MPILLTELPTQVLRPITDHIKKMKKSGFSIQKERKPCVLEQEYKRTTHMLKPPLLALSTLALLVSTTNASAYELYANEDSHANAMLDATHGTRAH